MVGTRWPRRRRLAGQVRQRAVQVAVNELDDRLGINAARDMMHEEYQQADANEGQHDCAGYRQVRHEHTFVGAAHATQHH